jgi:hypothetical protein
MRAPNRIAATLVALALVGTLSACTSGKTTGTQPSGNAQSEAPLGPNTDINPVAPANAARDAASAANNAIQQQQQQQKQDAPQD